MIKYNRIIYKYFIFLSFIFFSSQNILFSYEQIQIDYPDKSSNLSATTTYYFKGVNSKALIIYFPGGDGKVYRNCNLRFTDPFIKLTEKNSSDSTYDFVCFNSDKT